MGKYLQRKHSYMKLKDEDASCLWPWALYRIVNHHRWHGFKKLITYKKPKTQIIEKKDKGKRKKLQQASMPDEQQNMNSAKAIWNIFGYGLFSKKSNKSSIKPEDSSISSPDLQQSKIKSFDEEDNNCVYDSNAPTLLSLLKAYPFPKMINTTSNHQQATKTDVANDSKEDESNLLELLRVNQDMFLQMLQDGSSKLPKLVKSGTFPSSNRARNMVLGRTPSKVEHKHNEIWPISSNNNNDGGELRRIKLQKLGRLASFNESYVRNNGHFDGNSRDIYRKNRSKSLQLRNEKDFMLLALSELPQASLERLNSSSKLQTRGLSFKFGKDFGVGVDDELDGDGNNKNLFVVEPLKNKNHQEEKDEEDMVEVISIDGDFEMNDEMISLGCTSESSFEDRENWDNVKSSNTKDTLCTSITTPTNENVDEIINSSYDNSTQFDDDMDYYNQDLLYVKYILDVMGFSSSGNEDPNPLDPAIFDAIEICCPFEPTSKSSILNNKDANFDNSMPIYRRKLLFDLVNEGLNYILEQSNGYYPKALSSICHVRPMLKGKNRVVDELLEYTSDCLSWKPELDQTLKFAVIHEISDKRTGWMNLQRDYESVGLELEDMILDELLDEIVFGDLCE